ncbi:hypothetical protein [Pleomorphovibrio marinus]|uniref:hypothetical protein n=1 Tax=Pleomorphovibrio marinus TaxID=2164132 RepID=UPI000E0A6975|nr:hypothetical protein [Pleomorphovibrio marinus]
MTTGLIGIILLSLSGFILALYSLKNRSSIKVKEDSPIDHIKGMYILKIPYEKIVVGYFGLMLLAYTSAFFMGGNPEKIDLIWLLVSSCAFLLFLYKLALSFSEKVVFKWPTLFFSLFNLAVAWLIFQKLGHPIESLIRAVEYTLTFHLLGMILGLGGTFILDILIFHFLRDFKINKQEAVIMHLISQLIIIGLILLIVTGFALFLTDTESYLASGRFLMKMTAVLVLTVNGLILNFYMMPEIEKLSLTKEDLDKYQPIKKVAFAVGAVSMISWFAAFFFAMIKDLETFDYIPMLIVYVVLLIGGVGGSQLAKFKLEKEVRVGKDK